jgi:hypothetical protein
MTPSEEASEPPMATHSPEWYRPLLDAGQARMGDQMLIRCVGGPSIVHLAIFPPPLEIEEAGGIYVLDDDGPVYNWRYEFVPKAF